jgi:hypothetical protein
MYSSASEDADVVSQSTFGVTVEIMEARDGWLRIRTPDGYPGWVRADDFVRRPSPYAASGKAAEVISLFAHLYRSPSVTRHRPLLTVPFETRLESSSIHDDQWMEVRLPDGRAAFIQTGDVRDPEAPLETATLTELSRRFLGLPYTWGGTSSFGYDCSGFTQMLMRKRGVHMPRDAHRQQTWSGLVPIDRVALAPGDLLFFGATPGKVTHTGMYIGSGEFIHATAHLKPVIQISRLDEAHWTERFISAGRVK